MPEHVTVNCLDGTPAVWHAAMSHALRSEQQSDYHCEMNLSSSPKKYFGGLNGHHESFFFLCGTSNRSTRQLPISGFNYQQVGFQRSGSRATSTTQIPVLTISRFVQRESIMHVAGGQYGSYR
jgi:hypothetical protein